MSSRTSLFTFSTAGNKNGQPCMLTVTCTDGSYKAEGSQADYENGVYLIQYTPNPAGGNPLTESWDLGFDWDDAYPETVIDVDIEETGGGVLQKIRPTVRGGR